MPDTPTPGQVAYEAWRADILGTRRPPDYAPWKALHPNQRRAWEAAARAVLTQALADRVWARQAPSSRWQETPQEETPDA